jgi:rhodanese-related sulfurtransferase
MESLEKGLSYDLIFPEEIETWQRSVRDGLLVDVRPSTEFYRGRIPQGYSIPFDQLSTRVESLPREQPLLIICENGVKSVSACEILHSKGFMFLYLLKGGMGLYQGPLETSESNSITT